MSIKQPSSRSKTQVGNNVKDERPSDGNLAVFSVCLEHYPLATRAKWLKAWRKELEIGRIEAVQTLLL